jgi:hypothetical protein
MIAIQPVYWRIGRIYRKYSFLYYCVLARVYRAVACQRVDQIRYNTNGAHNTTPTSIRTAQNNTQNTDATAARQRKKRKE